MAKKHETATEPETTGHEWDGIHELNKPLPKWWLWTFYATIVWAIGYWLLMPAWPLVSGYTKGLLAIASARRWQRSCKQRRRPKRDSASRSPRAILQRSVTIPNCCASRSPAARRRLATIVRPVTAEARKGRSVTRTCVTIHGYGGARSLPSIRPSPTVSGPMIPTRAAPAPKCRPSAERRFGRTRRSPMPPNTCYLCRVVLTIRRPPIAAPRFSPPRVPRVMVLKAGQSGDRRAGFDGRALALCR